MLSRLTTWLGVWSANRLIAEGGALSTLIDQKDAKRDALLAADMRVRFHYCSASDDGDFTTELARTGDQPRRMPGDAQPQPLPEVPGTAVWDAAARTLTVPDLPAHASFLVAWRQVVGGQAEEAGVSTTGTVSVSQFSPFVPGGIYDVWVTGRNSRGDGWRAIKSAGRRPRSDPAHVENRRAGAESRRPADAARGEHRPAAEVLIVVNRIGLVDKSVAAAVEALEQRPLGHLRVAVQRVEGNLGVAGSWNRIFGHFGGDCWIVNSDIAFTPGVLGEAMARVAAAPEIVQHHLWAMACFHVTADFTRTLGWFDENFYPAYCEDQEMDLRSVQLGMQGRIRTGLDEERVAHAGSQTLRSASAPLRRFIKEGHACAGRYLERRWGALPPPGEGPVRRHPFDNPALHGADWTLDMEARAALARRCEAITGFACPVVFHRAQGGLG